MSLERERTEPNEKLTCSILYIPTVDDLLYPDWREQKIKAPLFIVGNARSGTTFAHRVLASSSSSFTYFRTWEVGGVWGGGARVLIESRAEQYKVEQNRTEQSRAEQNRTEQNRAREADNGRRVRQSLRSSPRTTRRDSRSTSPRTTPDHLWCVDLLEPADPRDLHGRPGAPLWHPHDLRGVLRALVRGQWRGEQGATPRRAPARRGG